MRSEYKKFFEFSGSSARLIAAAAVLLVVALLWPAEMIGILGLVSLLIYLKKVSGPWGDSRPFKIFAAGVALRFFFLVLFAVISSVQGKTFVLFGDSGLNFDAADVALRVCYGTWDLSERHVSLVPGFYGYTIYHWINGAFYLIAGYSPFLLKLVNVVASCLAVWIVYLISFRITANRTVSAWAMGLGMFWPSNIMWSIDLLKEPVIQLYTAVIIYLFVDMLVRRKWSNLIILILIWYPIGHFRKSYQWVILVTILISSMLFIPRRFAVGFLLVFILAVAGIMVMSPAGVKDRLDSFQQRVIATQVGFITTGGSYYVFVPDRFKSPSGLKAPMTMKETLISYLKAVYFYLGTPRPFTRLSLNKLPGLPQMIIWYLMLILFLPAGVLYLLRYRCREAGAVLVFLAVATSAMALFTGNEGTAFRHRDVLTLFYFIPITVGMFNIRGWLAGKYREMQPALARSPVKSQASNFS